MIMGADHELQLYVVGPACSVAIESSFYVCPCVVEDIILFYIVLHSVSSLFITIDITSECGQTASDVSAWLVGSPVDVQDNHKSAMKMKPY